MEFAAAQDESTEIGEEDIVEHIFEAVIEQRLPPGTKLSESALCDAFGVGRMRIRRALLLLASRQIVDLQANRGAFVASPTAEQAHEVFEARLMLEPSITRLAVQRATDAEIAMLAAHIEREHEAHHIGRRRDAIRLSGQFHGLLAQVAGNSVMLRMMRELITRTSLIIGIFGAQDMTDCRDHDHSRIVDAIRRRDAEEGARLMQEHLAQIKRDLDLSGRATNALDLVSILKRQGTS
ncbi:MULTISPECIES: GntR family transcriptional regulator [Paracoccus]|uniref:GntR family transcriptional regulator n=1 Tax=Paracoccus versutus TaxID=34007 RepID=A0A369TTZ1_PARVE|nr:MULTISPECIES: GntR family transcriptional regulator [Paracoccus]WGR59529.1 GntR family transcriptional regulator [Paracoccus ferrooxidans]SFY10668.1 DNA-binding transcriptional regulator, GntR family [Paracoccus pantotrophus]MBT0778782.1 GntR family transcriptional regulator [Paracoccus sp. pheM1]MCJ1900568.1 GntR family transcriptional regulator [Paracoccus versutus]MDF3905577.1 GntR family transcriptional regulator [Paracoccus sp. AS002]